MTLFKNLHLLSSIDYKVTLNQWVEQSTKYINGFTEQDAQIYFVTYRALSEEVENGNKNDEIELAEY